MGNDTRQLSDAAVAAISQRLAVLTDLRLPAQLRRPDEGPNKQSKQDYLRNLLLHDPGVFLERYGSSLLASERGQFECLRGDYEVDFYMKVLEDQEDRRKQGQVAKNRRLAYMNRLVREGAYFSEKKMRERQPGMHFHYIGQYRPPEQPAGGDGCRAGSVLADSIMRQQEELSIRERQQAEERQWDQVQEECEEEEEEEQETEEEGSASKPGAAVGGQAAAPESQRQQQEQQQPRPGEAGPQQPGSAAAAAASGGQEAGAEGGGEAEAEPAAAYVHIPEEERGEYAAAFEDIMRQRFLAGQDAGVDYAAIDADAELDDDWAVQQGRDAEDKYFGDE